MQMFLCVLQSILAEEEDKCFVERQKPTSESLSNHLHCMHSQISVYTKKQREQHAFSPRAEIFEKLESFIFLTV